MRPGSKRKLQDSDVSFSSETTAVMEEEDLITFDYQHFDADAPSTKSQNGNGLNLANLQFNALNVIGMLSDTTIHVQVQAIFFLLRFTVMVSLRMLWPCAPVDIKRNADQSIKNSELS